MKEYCISTHAFEIILESLVKLEEERDSNVNYKVDHHDNQIFDHPEAKFFVV